MWLDLGGISNRLRQLRDEPCVPIGVLNQVEGMVPRQVEQVLLLVRIQLTLQLRIVLLIAPAYQHVGSVGTPELVSDDVDLVQIVAADDRLQAEFCEPA